MFRQELGSERHVASLTEVGVSRILVVSNRVSVPRKGARNAGGLEVVIRSLLQRHEGIWFGWSGAVSKSGQNEVRVIEHDGMTCAVTDLSKDDYEEYYEGFAKDRKSVV